MEEDFINLYDNVNAFCQNMWCDHMYPPKLKEFNELLWDIYLLFGAKYNHDPWIKKLILSH